MSKTVNDVFIRSRSASRRLFLFAEVVDLNKNSSDISVNIYILSVDKRGCFMLYFQAGQSAWFLKGFDENIITYQGEFDYGK